VAPVGFFLSYLCTTPKIRKRYQLLGPGPCITSLVDFFSFRGNVGPLFVTTEASLGYDRYLVVHPRNRKWLMFEIMAPVESRASGISPLMGYTHSSLDFLCCQKNGMFQFDGCSPSGNLHSTPWFEIVVLLKKKHDSRDRSWLGKMVLGAKNLPPVGGQVHVVPLDPQDRGIFCLPSLHSSGFRILGYVQKNPSLTGIGSRTSGVLEMIPPLTWNGYPLVGKLT